MTAPQPARRSGRAKSTTASHRPDRSIPTTIWAAGTDPTQATAGWPIPVVSRAVTEFSHSKAKVILLDWPTHPFGSHRNSDAHRSRRTSNDVAAVVESLDRTVTVIDAASASGVWVAASCGGADLVITNPTPEHHDLNAGDSIAAAAAALLCEAGVLVVLTHSLTTSRGELVDPTSHVVAAAQGADLLYLQHIVAVPIREDTVLAAAPDFETLTPMPVHRRIHTDVLVFLQPHDFQAGNPGLPA
ncbi:hypothetical protein ACQPW1_39455 [Nocardia sp. CA-128927]|uniref:hypothetical protein n=1 Tax=Nocardia sp. CA-128927 TaxID=3239975 RepID=UPI003D9793C3